MICTTTRKQLLDSPAGPATRDDLATMSGELRDLLLSNPMVEGADEEPVQLLGMKGTQVIGRMNLVAGRVCVGGETLPILWGSGYEVPPEHRHTGIGPMLLIAMQSLPCAVGAVGASQMAAPLYQKLRWIDLVAPRFVLPRRARRILERFLGDGALCVAASAVADLGLAAWARMLAFATWRGTRGLRVERAERIPDALEPQLREIDRPAHCPRSAAWINWILSARSGDPALYLVRDLGGAAVGYFIVTHRHHEAAGGGKWRNLVLGSVKDWMTFDPQAVTDVQLVRLAIRRLLDREVDAIDVCVAEPQVGAALRRWGLREVSGMHFTFWPRPSTPLCDPKYHRIDAWRFRPADGDYFLF